MLPDHNKPHPQRDAILALLNDGMGPSEVARRLGVTKNVVIGLKSRAGLSVEERAPLTLCQRLDALHRNLDAVLAVNLGIGKVPNVPKGART